MGGGVGGGGLVPGGHHGCFFRPVRLAHAASEGLRRLLTVSEGCGAAWVLFRRQLTRLDALSELAEAQSGPFGNCQGGKEEEADGHRGCYSPPPGSPARPPNWRRLWTTPGGCGATWVLCRRRFGQLNEASVEGEAPRNIRFRVVTGGRGRGVVRDWQWPGSASLALGGSPARSTKVCEGAQPSPKVLVRRRSRHLRRVKRLRQGEPEILRFPSKIGANSQF
jgi:hypothetical protein